MYEGHPESKERLRIQSAHLFCCSRSLVSGVQYDVGNSLTQFYIVSHGRCRDSCGYGCAIENPADYEVRGVIRFLQADEILGYLAEEVSCCTRMHVRILPGRHKPYCVSNSIGTSTRILHTARTWHHRTFSCLQK